MSSSSEKALRPECHKTFDIDDSSFGWRCAEAAALPAWRAESLGPVESTSRLTTRFPERARWREAAARAGGGGEAALPPLPHPDEDEERTRRGDEALGTLRYPD